jgi:hypothetical protein
MYKEYVIALLEILVSVRAILQSEHGTLDACKGKPKIRIIRTITREYLPCKGKPKRKL